MMGRPKIPNIQKKVKVNVALDPDIYEFLLGIKNRSKFVNEATKILVEAYKNEAKREHSEEESPTPA